MTSSSPVIRVALYARIDEYVDKGISGSRERRPALDRLRAACRKRLVDAVIVDRYDRFARSLRQLVNALEGCWRACFPQRSPQ